MSGDSNTSVTSDLGCTVQSPMELEQYPRENVKRGTRGGSRSEQPALSERDEIKWLVTRASIEIIMKIKRKFDDLARG